MAGGGAVRAAHPVLRAGIRVGGGGVDTGRTHRRGVEPDVVGIRGEEVHRPVPGDLVQPFPARGTVLEGVGHPGIAPQWRVGGLVGHPPADGGQHRVTPDNAGEVDPQLGDRHRCQMVVGVDETGQAHAPAQVDRLSGGVDELRCGIKGSDVDDVPATDHHRLRPGLRGITGPDRAVGQQVRASHGGPR